MTLPLEALPGEVRSATRPAGALLDLIAARGDVSDGFVVTVPGAVTLADYVHSFYTSWLFRLERFILRLTVRKPSTDAEAVQLASGEIRDFAAWSVEDRTDNQLVMRDYQGKTCSWFMVQPDGKDTRLWFGSGIVAPVVGDEGVRRPTLYFRLLMPFHRIYSRALLKAAANRLRAQTQRR